MPRTLISLGANLGSVHESMQSARRMLIDCFGAQHLAFSHLYKTPPVGGPDGQGDFLNAVVRIESTQSCWEIWETIKHIETHLGRQRQHRWEARRIDIDLLLHENQRVWTPHLKVPHPRMCMRTFVIKPALEIAAEWIEPVTGWTIQRLHDHMESVDAPVRPIVVLGSDPELLEQIAERVKADAGDVAGTSDVAGTGNAAYGSGDMLWTTVNAPSRLNPGLDVVPDALAMSRLTIAAVATPDPTTVLWEDYSQPWVRLLNMHSCTDTSQESVPLLHRGIGPRYLLPANDVQWAAHEILAAQSALTCPLEDIGPF